jgi:integrase
MNFVESIRERRKITHIRNLPRGEGRFHDLFLFTVGINTALRISDLLHLKVDHFMDDRQAIRKLILPIVILFSALKHKNLITKSWL